MKPRGEWLPWCATGPPCKPGPLLQGGAVRPQMGSLPELPELKRPLCTRVPFLPRGSLHPATDGCGSVKVCPLSHWTSSHSAGPPGLGASSGNLPRDLCCITGERSKDQGAGHSRERPGTHSWATLLSCGGCSEIMIKRDEARPLQSFI